MYRALAPLRETNEYQELMQRMKTEGAQVLVHGLSGAQKSAFASLFLGDVLADRKPHRLDEGETAAPFLFLSANQQSAQRLHEELNLLLPQLRLGFFPAQEDLTFEALAQSREAMGERVQLLKKLMNAELDGLVASVEAMLPLLMPPQKMNTLPIKLKVGGNLSLQEAMERLVQLGYQRGYQVELPGYFAQRGGILDIYPPSDSHPLRIELFGDEIDSIRRFSEESQLSLNSLREVEIYPARELVLTEAEIERGIAAIERDLRESVSALDNPEAAQVLSLRVQKLCEQLREAQLPDELEHYLPYFIAEPASLLDYYPRRPLVLCDEPLRIQEVWQERLQAIDIRLRQRFEMGELLPAQLNRWFEFDAFSSYLGDCSVLGLSLLPRRSGWLRSYHAIGSINRSLPSYQGAVQSLMDEVERWKQNQYGVLLLCDGPERGRRLQHTFSEYGLEVTLAFDSERAPLPGEVLIRQGAMQNCFEWPQARFILLSDHLLFGKAKRQRRSGVLKESKKLSSYRELVEGDLVVHVNHGIGRFLGIITMEIEGIRRDYLHLQYAGADKIYVPIDQISLVQKYLGGGGAEEKQPKLHALTGSEWQRSKQRVQKAVREMAEELLALYASRETMPGYAFSPDQPWQAEFEEQFPYEETEDQLQVIGEVKRDMESDRPMERLLCGDVGYGKTEVAIRAAFKAVLDGKQVAMLAPTTVLAQQHLNTFRERFSHYPVEIAMMSRFRTAKENQATTDLLRRHKIDIVIGTHRLLNKNVEFADLGLLIIDEEQRFGVAQKEKIKQLKANVDVLMLSATPIPRTLHMAMVGIRDMSVIETPPENRFPVQSYVVEWNEALVKEAIQRELDRDGQVFLVHNRITDLDYFAERISKLVPEARIVVGHGQMPQGRLEQVMLDFLEGEYDVLISTTIIESGLDMPNVNTLIVHEADKYGLSQLHQLRGRVGRSSRRAYAYFTFQPNRSLSEIAEKRLAAIKEFCELGAGFRIAQRDLELRGVGNLLGPQQHGNVSAVGFELYTQLLEETVRELKGERPIPKIEVTMELNLEAFLPSSYIQAQPQKIALYKRIQAAHSAEELDEIDEEMLDRFGPPPAPVVNLIKAAKIRLLADRSGIASLKQGINGVAVALKPKVEYDRNDIARLIMKMGGALIHNAGKPSPFTLLGESAPEILNSLEFFLQEFQEIRRVNQLGS